MKKIGEFNPRKFTLTIESWEGEDFSVSFDEGPDYWPVMHGLPLNLQNRLFYQSIADKLEDFAYKVIDQLQFIAVHFDEKGQPIESPDGWGYIFRGRWNGEPRWRLIGPDEKTLKRGGWKICKTAELPLNPDKSTVYIIVPPKEVEE